MAKVGTGFLTGTERRVPPGSADRPDVGYASDETRGIPLRVTRERARRSATRCGEETFPSSFLINFSDFCVASRLEK